MSSVSARSGLLAVLALVSLSACRTPMGAVDFGKLMDRGEPQLPQKAMLETSAGPVAVEYETSDEAAFQAFKTALEAVSPKLTRWGKLEDPLRIFLVTHDQLEWHSGRHGYPWLRAWATHDHLLLQSPSAFPVRAPTSEELQEIVLHELTHCLMFQRSATTTTWRRKQIPLWFREGLATYTAEQGYQYPALEDISRYYRAQNGLDPIAAPEALYQGDREIVYASAHHAFVFFVKRHGEEPVHRLMDRMAEGATFAEAFEQIVGSSPQQFLQEFKQYVTQGGFKAAPRFVQPPPSTKNPEPVPAPDDA